MSVRFTRLCAWAVAASAVALVAEAPLWASTPTAQVPEIGGGSIAAGSWAAGGRRPDAPRPPVEVGCGQFESTLRRQHESSDHEVDGRGVRSDAGGSCVGRQALASSATTQVPEINPTSITAGLAVVAGGVLVLRSRRRSK